MAEPGDQTKMRATCLMTARSSILACCAAKVVAQQCGGGEKLLFLPTNSPRYRASDDPLPRCAFAAYGVLSEPASSSAPFSTLESTMIKHALVCPPRSQARQRKGTRPVPTDRPRHAQQETTIRCGSPCHRPSTFASSMPRDEVGRQAHLNGPIAQALGANARRCWRRTVDRTHRPCSREAPRLNPHESHEAKMIIRI